MEKQSDVKIKKIFLIAGETIKGQNGKWHIADFDDTLSAYGPVGNMLRIIAAGVMYHKNNTATIVALGSRGIFKNEPDSPPIALLCENELITLGVPAGAIAKEMECGTTYEQLGAIEKILAEEREISGIIIS